MIVPLSSPYDFVALNGLGGDPAVYGFVRRTGDGLLFDLGDLSQMSHRDLLRVRHVFISHLHMDHFIGFDRLLRVHVPHRRLVRLYGPVGLMQSVQRKIQAYTWNLIDSDQIQFEVFELDFDRQEIRGAFLGKATDFALQPLVTRALTGGAIATLPDTSVVRAVSLTHKDIESIAYQIASPQHSKIDASALDRLGLKPGAWIKELQRDFATGQLAGDIMVQGQAYAKSWLAENIIGEAHQYRWVYLTDVVFSSANLRQLKSAFGETTTLFSESSFSRSDRDRAFEKAHLTSYQAALIAAYLGAERLAVFHISSIYGDQLAAIAEEAQREFSLISQWPPEQLQQAIDAELAASCLHDD